MYDKHYKSDRKTNGAPMTPPAQQEPKEIIPLDRVTLDGKARGEYCRSPYEGHPKGCPNFPKCIQNRIDFRSIQNISKWYAVIERFDLKAHADMMKQKHPHWTDRQCRNLLYWQGGVRKQLREKAKKFAATSFGSVVLDIPEAHGVEVFMTMAEHGVTIEHSPNTVTKVMLVGLIEATLRKHQEQQK